MQVPLTFVVLHCWAGAILAHGSVVSGWGGESRPAIFYTINQPASISLAGFERWAGPVGRSLAVFSFYLTVILTIYATIIDIQTSKRMACDYSNMIKTQYKCLDL